MRTTARSVPEGMSSIDLTDGTPSISSPLGLTGMTWPSNPASRMFLKIWNPIFSGFAEAPITARRLGRKSAWRESLIIRASSERVCPEDYRDEAPEATARAASLRARNRAIMMERRDADGRRSEEDHELRVPENGCGRARRLDRVSAPPAQCDRLEDARRDSERPERPSAGRRRSRHRLRKRAGEVLLDGSGSQRPAGDGAGGHAQVGPDVPLYRPPAAPSADTASRRAPWDRCRRRTG